MWVVGGGGGGLCVGGGGGGGGGGCRLHKGLLAVLNQEVIQYYLHNVLSEIRITELEEQSSWNCLK